jgi:hypothetical protein
MHLIFNNLFLLIIFATLVSCSNSQKTKTVEASLENKRAAIETLNSTLKPVTNAKVTTSIDIDWPAGSLPWDRFTLPVISPNGLHAAVQLGTSPPTKVLCGNVNTPVESTKVELHALDPIHGRKIAPLHQESNGLLLGRSANDSSFLVEAPLGSNGRWIGHIDWATGSLSWVVSDENLNCFPTINARGDIAWSKRGQSDSRFQIAVKTIYGNRVIDDGKSDWLMPQFVGNDRLRAYRIKDGQLSLVEFDLLASNPLLTSLSLPIVEEGATRELAWQIATTNPTNTCTNEHSFYHPILKRMVVWQPDNPIQSVSLAPNSVAAAPVSDGSWIVSTPNRVIRQDLGDEGGIHIRNQIALPIATTSKQWTHLLLIPNGNRLEIRAMCLSK